MPQGSTVTLDVLVLYQSPRKHKSCHSEPTNRPYRCESNLHRRLSPAGFCTVRRLLSCVVIVQQLRWASGLGCCWARIGTRPSIWQRTFTSASGRRRAAKMRKV